MKDLHPLFTNPFDDIHISFDGLKDFTTDHIQRMTSNPLAVLTPRLAATSAALATFSGTLTAAIAKIAVAVEAQFSEGSAEFLECFPHGRKEFSDCKDDKLENALQTLINGVTAHQPPLAATVVTSATALLTGWLAVYAPSESATGGKTTTQATKKAARAALALELYKNLLTLALQFPNQPAQLDLYMQLSLLGPHTPTPPTPPPVAPVLTRDANGKWTVAYDGSTQTYWQIWTRDSGNATWSESG